MWVFVAFERNHWNVYFSQVPFLTLFLVRLFLFLVASFQSVVNDCVLAKCLAFRSKFLVFLLTNERWHNTMLRFSNSEWTMNSLECTYWVSFEAMMNQVFGIIFQSFFFFLSCTLAVWCIQLQRYCIKANEWKWKEKRREKKSAWTK